MPRSTHGKPSNILLSSSLKQFESSTTVGAIENIVETVPWSEPRWQTSGLQVESGWAPRGQGPVARPRIRKLDQRGLGVSPEEELQRKKPFEKRSLEILVARVLVTGNPSWQWSLIYTESSREVFRVKLRIISRISHAWQGWRPVDSKHSPLAVRTTRAIKQPMNLLWTSFYYQKPAQAQK